MLKKTQTVSLLLLSLALSFGGNAHASEISTETSITQHNRQKKSQESLKMILVLLPEPLL